MNPLLLLRGDTLGKTLYNIAVATALAGLLGYLALGKFWHWRADRAVAVADARTVEAKQSDASATNAATARGTMDTGKRAVAARTEQSATRVESNETSAVDDAGGIDPLLVRELDAARDHAETASDRLQRARRR